MSLWKKMFGKSDVEESTPDPISDLVLDKLKPGWLVDYDGKTWEVTAEHLDDMGDGYQRHRWELKSDGQVWTLTREEVEGVFWTLTRKIPLGSIDGNIKGYIQNHGDPPNSIGFEDRFFSIQSYGGAKFHRNGMEPAQPFLYWEYRDESGEGLLIIEQWGNGL